jgi:hypothetical protein
MGPFDTIYLSSAALSAWRLRCVACGRVPGHATQWQTKSLDPCMHSYYIRPDETGAVRLFLLDPPSDRRLWRPWTEAEIAESEREAQRGPFALWRRKPGEGCFLPEAYLRENRRQRFMGELPHQWVQIYAACACGASMQRWIKFCDGIATETRPEPPRHEPGRGYDLTAVRVAVSVAPDAGTTAPRHRARNA